MLPSSCGLMQGEFSSLSHLWFICPRSELRTYETNSSKLSISRPSSKQEVTNSLRHLQYLFRTKMNNKLYEYSLILYLSPIPNTYASNVESLDRLSLQMEMRKDGVWKLAHLYPSLISFCCFLHFSAARMSPSSILLDSGVVHCWSHSRNLLL